MNKQYEYKNLKEFKTMIDDIFKDKYQVVIVANRYDILVNFKEIYNPSEHIKHIFGEDAILVEVPTVADWNSPFTTKKLFLENNMLVHVVCDAEETTTSYWLLDMTKVTP